MKSRLAVHDALYLKPLLFGLDRSESPFELVIDSPAKNSLKLRERSEEIRGAFLSPIDYARHGAEYCIVPSIGVSSESCTGTVQLCIKSKVRNIESLAVDVRFPSEIILAKIIMAEKYRNLANHTSLKILPMHDQNNDEILNKADAVLYITQGNHHIERNGFFSLDLDEEWKDLTDLPYVHGFWVAREGELLEEEVKSLNVAKQNGLQLQTQIAQSLSQQYQQPADTIQAYLSSFSYDFGEKEENCLHELFHYAFFYGVIGDIPNITYFDV